MKILGRSLPAALLIALLLVTARIACAQAERLQLSLGKISGIGLGSQIQGLFRLSVSGPADIVSVTFEMDGTAMGTVTQAPYSFQFHTDSYAPGQHRFTATARTSGGKLLTSNSVDAEIVSLSAGWQSAVRLLWPIFAIILLALLAAFAVPLLSLKTSRRYTPGAQRQYGLAGGTVCGRCGRPYALSLLNLQLIVGRLARCPYCGKWSLARPASQAALRAAELAEVQNQPVVHEPTPEEILRQQIEDSRLSK